MYQPNHHKQDDLGAQHALIRSHPLGLLVTMGAAGLEANQIPFVLDPTCGTKGVLKGHLARANRQWRNLDDSVDALVVFRGPDTYISPSWYATKAETGKVVPTWNYAVVQVRGQLRVIEDRAWLRAQVEALTRDHEARRPKPWAVSDAPPPFIDAMVRGVVGLELEIAGIAGKWKVSQNRPEADKEGVITGLRADGEADQLAIADLVEAASGESR
ncbi:MAG: FMN-binding negative transcriptional regulator [Hyphomicrobiales bacterium]|nr:FMN-binding negative transcriptional regulator [Hyphomicrobiales bacterium]